MKRLASCAAALGLTTLGAALAPSWADMKPLAEGGMYGGEVQRAAALLQAKKIISVGEALTRVPEVAQGQLLQSVFREKSPEAGDRMAYEIYMLGKDGLIWEVILDAATGEVLSHHAEGAAGSGP